MNSFTPARCAGCVYRSQGKTQYNMCQFSQITGQLRGCSAEECTHKTFGKPTRSRSDIAIKPAKKKRVLLTEEEKRLRHNALHKAERAKKKAASLLEQESGAVENNSI